MQGATRIAVLMTTTVMSVWPQFLPPVEADTPEEFDDYLSVEGAESPKARLAKIEAFRSRWPKSGMMPRILELEFLAWKQEGRAAEARKAGEAALAAAPDNLAVKAALAGLVAASDEETASRLARETLTALETFRAPRRVSVEAWARITGAIRAQAHMALGVVEFNRGNTAGALKELEEADRASPIPDAAIYLRLGRVYALLGRKGDARRQFERVMQTGDSLAVKLAEEELVRLK
jgi:tetratricopeptide (TPR) repeat protein